MKMSTKTRRIEELLGLPVLSVHEGQKLGTISGVLIRREDRTVEAIGVGGGPFRQARYLRLSQLSTIGQDAVMVPSAAILRESLSGQHIRTLDASLPGRPVMSESGQRLGEVTSFTLSTATGRIESYRIRPDASGKSWLASLMKSGIVELADAHVLSLGQNALIVRDDAVSLLKPDAAESAAEPDAPAPPGAGSDEATV
jgi:uncharacterized protein YrrD